MESSDVARGILASASDENIKKNGRNFLPFRKTLRQDYITWKNKLDCQRKVLLEGGKIFQKSLSEITMNDNKFSSRKLDEQSQREKSERIYSNILRDPKWRYYGSTIPHPITYPNLTLRLKPKHSFDNSGKSNGFPAPCFHTQV